MNPQVATQLSTTAIFKPKGRVVLRRVAGEVLLVPVKGTVADMQYLFALEGIGESVWKLLDGVRTVDDIVALVENEFEGDVADIRADVDAFVGSLLESDLVEEIAHV